MPVKEKSNWIVSGSEGFYLQYVGNVFQKNEGWGEQVQEWMSLFLYKRVDLVLCVKCWGQGINVGVWGITSQKVAQHTTIKNIGVNPLFSKVKSHISLLDCCLYH
jgi:hypothetical protein